MGGLRRAENDTSQIAGDETRKESIISITSALDGRNAEGNYDVGRTSASRSSREWCEHR